jgi:hypothetical protein
MKRSELKTIIKEIANEEIGKTISNSKIGSKTTLTAADPEAGKYSWDVSYDIDPRFLYNKLDQLINYLQKAPKESELSKFRDILKNLKNRTFRIMNI